MFDLERGTLTQQGKELSIVKWEIWFMCPKGLASDLRTAVEVCRESDWEPNAVIQPMPVAIDEGGRYEIILKG